MDKVTGAITTVGGYLNTFQDFAVAVPAPLGVLSFQLFTFCVALNNAYFLRKAMRWDVHWVRALTTLAVLTLGGASLAALLKGGKIPALEGTAVGNGQLVAVVLAYLITFCVPGGSLIVGTPQVRPVWQGVQALNVAFSVKVAIANAPAGASGLLIAVLAVVQATGGAMIAEYTNMLLLSPEAYKCPQGGPGPNTLFAIIATLATFALNVTPVVKDMPVNTLVALALVAVNILTTPDKTQELCARALSWIPNGSVVEPEEHSLEEEEDLPWPLCDGLWGYELSPSDYEGDGSFGNFFWAGDDEDDEEEEAEASAAAGAEAAPKAKSPAAKAAAKAKSPAAKAKSPAAAKAKSPAPPAPAAGRRRAGSKAK